MVKRLDPRVTRTGDRPALSYEGDPEEMVHRKAVHAALRDEWTDELTQELRAFWDVMSGAWAAGRGPDHTTPLVDALERTTPHPSRVLEVGCGTGHGTRELRRLLPASFVVAVDISAAMLRETRTGGFDGPLVACSSAALPFPDGVFDSLVLLNTYLFPREVRRVVARGGIVIGAWSIAEATPIYVSAEQAEAALDAEVEASDAGWGSWWRGRLA